MSIDELGFVSAYQDVIRRWLERIVNSTNGTDIELAISDADYNRLVQEIQSIRSRVDLKEENAAQFAAVEAVFREIFIDLIANVPISDPAFVQVWILLDIITILSDNELCEAGLSFWLVEELLDGQTIEGCRKVFDYLESRREQMTAKHFKHKSLVILRCCNELLRRLSRAEDTVFCGRVFIFLFQSFPLGDKSSVNLRGEFHIENVTTFDALQTGGEDGVKPMEVDSTGGQANMSGAQTPIPMIQDADAGQKVGRSTPSGNRSTKGEPKSDTLLDLDTLYPKFWTLQSFFSAPTRLFEASAMVTFKDGIAATLSYFKSITKNSPPITNSSENRRGTKRKRGDVDSTSATSTFNPKYLTNRDLFDLEVHDVAFRRHVLVQALIMLDFLLSLTPPAQAKFTGLTNKSVLYSYSLSEEDAKWAQSTRSNIATYLQQGNSNEGKFYYRMVDTVLSRDKNWVRWKAENCPSISKPAVDAQTQMEAQKTLGELCSQPPLIRPPGANDLEFLSRTQSVESLKHPSERYQVPTMAEYWKGIQTDELDIDFAAADDEKRELEEKKAGRVWRALRASPRRFVLCDKIQYGSNLKALVDTSSDPDREQEEDKPGTSEDTAAPTTEGGVAADKELSASVNS